MDLISLEEKLSSYGSGGYYLLESFLIQIVKAEAESHNQPLEIEGELSYSKYDAFAPNGLGNISGPLAIEVVHELTQKRLQHEANKFSLFANRENQSLLLISARQIGIAPESLKKIVSQTNIRLYLWGENEIQALIEKHAKTAAELSDKLFYNRFQRVIASSTSDWKDKRDAAIQEISACYKSGRFSMLLGAGVSSSAGLPDWDTLLNSLFVSMLTEDTSEKKPADASQISSIVKRLRQIDGPSALMLARYIRKGISADSSTEQGKFIAAVTRQLYSLRNKRFAISSPLIRAIASLCVPGRTGAKVKALLTYNFDDLIERELKDRGLSHKSIYEEVELPSPEELPIYHVHGFLPENRSDYPNIDKATLVFSEEGYHQIYRESYHWSNLIQLNSLKETTCLMIGLSLTDPNLRRLLEISAKSLDRPKHFAFMRRVGFENFTKDGEKLIVSAPSGIVRRYLERHHSLNEEVMRELGVTIIWYEEYDDIPKILKEIGKCI